MLLISKEEVELSPYPHLLKEGILPYEFYNQLLDSFPEIENNKSKRNYLASRTGQGNDIYRGDEIYNELINKNECWKEFSDYINSSKFMFKIIDLFGDQIDSSYSPLDTNKMFFDHQFIEHRGSLSKPKKFNLIDKIRIRFGKPPSFNSSEKINSIYSRLDIHNGEKGYNVPVHCDRSNRVISFVLYFCDKEEIGMKGGELGIYDHKERKKPWLYERNPSPNDVQLITKIKPKHNTGIIFLGTNNSYHAAEKIQSIESPRKFLYINLSSKAERVW